MEVAGLVCGALPLIVMTFQGYRLVRNFATEYNLLNHKLRGILRDISTEGSLFKYAFNEILAETVAEDERKRMLDNPQSEYWARHDLHGEIERVLGDLFLPMVESVAGVQETLQEIKTLLLRLSGNKISANRKQKQPLKRLTMSVAAIATSVLQSDPLGLHFKNIQIQSKPKKLLSLAKGHRGALEILRNQLREQNRYLQIILNFRSNSRSAAQGKIPIIRQISPRSTAQTSQNEPDTMAIPDEDTRVVQQDSQNLHRIISSSLSCDCHIVHLCLERQQKEAPPVEDPKGKLPQSPATENETRFSFQLSSCSGIRVSITSRRVIHLIFTKRRPRSTDPVITSIVENVTPTLTFCQLAQNDGYESYLPDTSGSCASGFLLQHVTAPMGWAKFSTPISLEDLVISRSAEILSLDRLLIAAKLAHSLVHYYSSPWVRDWSLRTIHFFEKHEQPDTAPGRWTPHLALTANSHGTRRLEDRNQEIYLLGLMLLQLGRKKCLEYSDAETKELTLQKALRDLCQEMGLKYTTFVQNCLASWSDRSADLMGARNLDLFLSHVRGLEDYAKEYLSL